MYGEICKGCVSVKEVMVTYIEVWRGKYPETNNINLVYNVIVSDARK
jgi:hypothetical protein